MGKIVAVAQQKGGAGKTLIAVQLATALSDLGNTVALVDSDPQQSLSYWAAVRRERTGADGPHHESVEGWKAPSEVKKLARRSDVVIVDTAPHADTATRTTVRAADLVLVPIQPSPMDYWATKGTIDLIEGEKRPYLLILNRVPPRARLSDEIRALLKKERAPVARAKLGNRQAFPGSIMAGGGVIETEPRSIAAKEARALAREVAKKLQKA